MAEVLCQAAFNPGSLGHPEDCKPCRQLNLDGGCKYGKLCNFCHLEHPRVKHRSQRGRHSLQKKEFQQQKDKLPKEQVRLVDRIYDEMENYYQAMKQIFSAVSQGPNSLDALEEQVAHEITQIGSLAQEMRPDSARIPAHAGETKTVQTLQAKCKWLSGTVHLCIRKWCEAEDETVWLPHNERLVNECLGRLKGLTGRLTRLKEDLQAVEERLGSCLGANLWLRPILGQLIRNRRLREGISQKAETAELVKELYENLERLLPVERTDFETATWAALEQANDLVAKKLEEQTAMVDEKLKKLEQTADEYDVF
ncbi:unnamed protein product [Effrenium voratum]|nr:unnamed protein product [Effrenium voratum]